MQQSEVPTAANAILTRFCCARAVELEAQREWRECLRVVMMQVDELVE